MGLNLTRICRDFLELSEAGTRWIEETRDRYVNSVVLWFHMNKEQILIKFKKNPVLCVAVVLLLALIVIHSPILGYEGAVPRWIASWIAWMSIFAVISLTYQIFVEMKRFKLTWKKYKKVYCSGMLLDT
ncbi:hypothetical protein DCAR_0933494 [Daucus carota subsp. sativus]|uniref:Uncharacterized protein n=1 Tax=Daucus carota subsp. sativus TaxID=79200 RepID=A0A175YD29_DAUCS|nr:PREDICTED: uncharacterized protein LOC108200869 [Daucus carota subsp. sativus]WOH13979.1 hypothetical protein DCAR_0933494 [Daucus carota subsp. sativus]